MNDKKISEWFIKSEGTNGEVQGPFSPRDLVQQACEGRVLGDTDVSANPSGPWLKAESLEALEMDWQVLPPEAPPLPRCHVMALRNWVEEETVQPYWDIRHVPSDEMYDVVDALCSALLAQNRVLENRLASPKPAPAASSSPDGSPQEIRVAFDDARKEAAKWKGIYEDEIKRNESREQELLQDNESLRAWQRKAAERIKALERRQATLKESRQLAESVENFSGDGELAAAYEELKLQMAHLMDSLQLKSEQLDETRVQARELQLQLRNERKSAEEKVTQVSQLHEDTLDQLNRLEHAHVHLTRSYRDLNDRLIRLRNQKPSGDSVGDSPEKRESEKPGKKTAAAPQPKKPGGPTKISMT